jgi:hypothetical protein
MKLSSLEAIATALGEANVRYLIVGGLAVAATVMGERRSTSTSSFSSSLRM